jgi:hypothetical protein
MSQGEYPNSLSFCCFHFGLVVESIKELGGALVEVTYAKLLGIPVILGGVQVDLKV